MAQVTNGDWGFRIVVPFLENGAPVDVSGADTMKIIIGPTIGTGTVYDAQPVEGHTDQIEYVVEAGVIAATLDATRPRARQRWFYQGHVALADTYDLRSDLGEFDVTHRLDPPAAPEE
ncbi:MAG TPA: hypothetical protein VMW52_06840 [Phycisphaerae bacterium]|nr:hypothetical protein [Phycisphaerae bacterium]